MLSTRIPLAAVLMIGIGAAGCAPKTLVVLAPSPDRPPGRVVVSNAAGTVELTTPYTATTVASATSAPKPPAAIDPAEVKRVFGSALAAMPAAPRHFLLYFATATTDLDPESERRLQEVMDAIRDSGATWVSVVGHTDSSGDAAANLALSTRRAAFVVDRLAAMGAPREIFDVTSHGENNPLVKTEDNVAEPRNRRVEVIVR